MQIIKINYKKPDPRIIRKAAKIIKEGGIVVVPTETVYGILGDGLNKKTVKKLLKFKKRGSDKRFDLTLYPVEKIFRYVEFNPLIQKIIERFPEQPLSFGLPKKKSFPGFLSPGFKMNAFHFFFSEIDRELFKYIDMPLIGTSANLSELPDTHSIKEVAEHFRHTFGSSLEPDLILDGGKLPPRKPSAIIELVKKDIRIIRPGDISLEIIEKKLKKRKDEI